MPAIRRTARIRTTCRNLNPAPPAVTLFCLSLALRGQAPADARKLYAESAKSVLLLVVKSDSGQIIGQGSGFVIAGGKVLTNEHVARGGTVMLDLGAVKVPAIVDRVDAENDLALLSTSAELAVRALPLAKDTPQPGTPIYAIGNPAGLEQSISNGVVAANRNWNGRQLLQITAPISPGSSGGPILNEAGEVVGIAVGILEKGQNINFAVPVSVIHAWLNGDKLRVEDAEAILKRVDALTVERDQLTYSADAGSPWMRLDSRIDALIKEAVDRAGQDPTLLYKIATLSETQNIDIAISAAERAKTKKATMEIHFLLGRLWKAKARYGQEADKPALLAKAEAALKLAFTLANPLAVSADLHFHLGDVLEDRGSYAAAEVAFRRALKLAPRSAATDLVAESLRGVVRTTHMQDKTELSADAFKDLISTGKANAFDWEQAGSRYDRERKYSESGKSYRQAALLRGSWTNWCESSGSFAAAGEDDLVLETARRCISEGSGKKASESRLADANYQIARVLNSRDLHQEALVHVREASALRPENPWAFSAQAEALLGLRRPQEATNAIKQALRLSDGKYGTMHFNLARPGNLWVSGVAQRWD